VGNALCELAIDLMADVGTGAREVEAVEDMRK
jgi:hypothetical protein